LSLAQPTSLLVGEGSTKASAAGSRVALAIAAVIALVALLAVAVLVTGSAGPVSGPVARIAPADGPRSPLADLAAGPPDLARHAPDLGPAPPRALVKWSPPSRVPPR